MKRNPIIYKNKNQSFQNYLNWSNEKDVVLKTLKEIIPQNSNNLLDIGTGNGTLCSGLEGMFASITAVEPSKNSIDELRKKCSSKKYHIIHDDFDNLDIKEKFDVILLSHSIRFLQNPEKQIMKIQQLLNKEGIIIIVANAVDRDFSEFYQTFKKEIVNNPKDDFYFNYEKMLMNNGFKVKVIKVNATLNIPTIDDAISLLDFFYDTDISSISSDTKNRIRYYLNKKYGNGPVVFKFPQEVLTAKVVDFKR